MAADIEAHTYAEFCDSHSYDKEMESMLPLPPAFRFHPTDEELVCNYLQHKAANQLSRCEPWDLPAGARTRRVGLDWAGRYQGRRRYLHHEQHWRHMIYSLKMVIWFRFLEDLCMVSVDLKRGGSDHPPAGSITPSRTPTWFDIRSDPHIFLSLEVYPQYTSSFALKDDPYVPELGGAYGNGRLQILRPKIIGEAVCFVCRRTTASGSRVPLWNLDSAASYSTTGNLALLQGVHAADPASASSATGQTMWSTHCGRTNGRVSLSGVRYFPGAPNLISLGHLCRLGCGITMNSQGCIIKKGGALVGVGRLLEIGTFSLEFLDDRLLDSICSCCPRH